MTIKEYQQRVNNWIETTGKGYFDVKTNGLILGEEVGEVLRILAREQGQQTWKEEKEKEQIQEQLEDEICDVLFVLSCLANQMNIDIEKAIEENFKKKTNRDFLRHQDNRKIQKKRKE